MEKLLNVFPNTRNVEYDAIYHFTMGDCFRFLEGNREINKAHARKIERAIVNEGAASFIDAISVDINTWIVVDGQHRLTAFREAWKKGMNVEMDVRFKNYPEDMLPIIIKMNSNHKNWTTNDHALSIRKEGNVMDKLFNFCTDDAHQLLHRKNKKGIKTPVLRYATALILGRTITNDIKNNNVVITDEQFAFGHQLHNEAQAILNALQLRPRNAWIEGYLTAWHNIRKDKLYSDALNQLGFETFLQHIPTYVERMTERNVREWERQFKEAIIHITEDTK